MTPLLLTSHLQPPTSCPSFIMENDPTPDNCNVPSADGNVHDTKSNKAASAQIAAFLTARSPEFCQLLELRVRVSIPCLPTILYITNYLERDGRTQKAMYTSNNSAAMQTTLPNTWLRPFTNS